MHRPIRLLSGGDMTTLFGIIVLTAVCGLCVIVARGLSIDA
jgi:hypothetical protein